MWTIDLLEGVLGLWNGYMGDVWQLITLSPKAFAGGAVWPTIERIFAVMQGIGYGLLILFFAMSLFKQTASFRELRRPEQVFRLFIRFILTYSAITYGLEIINLIFEITGGIVSSIAASMGGLHQLAATLPDAIRQAVEDSDILLRAVIYIVGVALAGFVIVLSLNLLMTVYTRFFRIYLYVALAPLALSAFGGELTSRHGRTFVQSLCGVCLEAAVIALACIIFSAMTSTSSNTPVNLGDSGIGLVMGYMVGVIFQMLILISVVKSADRIIKEMTAL